MTRRKLFTLFMILAGTWLPVLLGHSKVEDVAQLFDLAELPNPYFVASHAALLYFWNPLVLLSSCVLLLSPGLLLTPGLNGSTSFGRWIAYSVGASIVIVSVITVLAEWISGAELKGRIFMVIPISCSVICFLFLLLRNERHRLTSPFASGSLFTLFICLAALYVVIVALTPKFFWDNLNGDGAHAYESARLLLRQPLPFWGPAAGPMSTYPGLTSMLFAYPASWFIRLFGDFEASVRLPMLLYVAGLFCALLALVQENASKVRIKVLEQLLLWFAVLTYVLVVVFNATYNPYSADIALPPARETLMVTAFLGFLLGFIRREHGWMVLFLCLTFFSLPTGAFFIAVWLFSVFVAWQPRPWRTMIFAGLALCGFVLLDVLLPHFLLALEFPVPGKEFSAEGIANRLGFGLKEWKRLLFLIVPCGILPALSLFLWKHQDSVSRSITVTTLLCFLFFFFQVNTALHHFIPMMILPLIVFWRMYVTVPSNRVLRFATGIAVLISFVISFPQNHSPHTTARMIGSMIEDRTDGYERSAPEGFDRAMILRHLFPLTWNPNVPKRNYGGSPLVWYFYAHRQKQPDQQINYVLQSSDQEPPRGMTLVAQEHGSSLYVLNRSIWAQQRRIKPPTPAGSKLYTLPHTTLYRRG